MKSATTCLSAWLALAAAALPQTVLIRGATVHTVSGPDIASGSVLIRDGKIAEVGVVVKAPKQARVLEAKGLHLYPGMIDSATDLGLAEITSVRETVDIREIGDFKPQLRTIIAVNSASEHIPVTRANGITSAVVLPEGGIISGQAAVIHLDGWTWEEMAARPSVAMVLQFPVIQQTPAERTGPSERRIPYAEAKKRYEARLRELDDWFERARRYQRARQAPASGLRPDLQLEAMLPVLERKLPVVIHAVREKAIREALAFAERQKIRIILAGARDADKLAAELKAKDVPVILPRVLELPLNEDDPYDRPFTLPAALHKAGVRFAFATYSSSFSRNLPYQAATAVAFGLPYQEALRGLTLYPAEIWGLNELGSVEPGKLANLILADGDLLEVRTQIKHVFVRGKEVDLNNKHTTLYEKYRNRP
ncbi:MAG: amidohydrolase family protein [Bryobacteraceae bacterium]|nr:amidohydrolase family protein [Bryobacteraceae bacterium]